ncbi:MAG: winged helix-turn-helix transcriptional regulator [Ruminococcaceae bacterium]|nr:winged helix-turn-helix transcriptional regulator [Oscillospiraceae bacterium]
MFILNKKGAVFLAEIHPEHAHIIEQTKANMPSEEILEKTAEVFKVFGDKTRIRILAALSEGEMCVCCICEILGMSQSAVSHQLSVLKSARLIKSRREGKQMYYSLDDAHIGAILCTGISHVEED